MHARRHGAGAHVEKAKTCSHAWAVVREKVVLAVYLWPETAMQACRALPGHDCPHCTCNGCCKGALTH